MKKLIVTVNGVSYEVEVEILEDEGSHPDHPVNYPAHPSLASVATQPLSYIPKPHVTPFSSSSDNFLRAPMNGKVIEIKAKQGEIIKSGQVVVELEAMKMKTNIYAPKDGVVKTILVAPGSLVESGQKLVEFE